MRVVSVLRVWRVLCVVRGECGVCGMCCVSGVACARRVLCVWCVPCLARVAFVLRSCCLRGACCVCCVYRACGLLRCCCCASRSVCCAWTPSALRTVYRCVPLCSRVATCPLRTFVFVACRCVRCVPYRGCPAQCASCCVLIASHRVLLCSVLCADALRSSFALRHAIVSLFFSLFREIQAKKRRKEMQKAIAKAQKMPPNAPTYDHLPRHAPVPRFQGAGLVGFSGEGSAGAPP